MTIDDKSNDAMEKGESSSSPPDPVGGGGDAKKKSQDDDSDPDPDPDPDPKEGAPEVEIQDDMEEGGGSAAPPGQSDDREEGQSNAEQQPDGVPKKKSPPSGEPTKKEYAYVVAMGLCMSFSAGYANGVALSGFMRLEDGTSVTQSVTGVTGMYTNSAIAAIQSDMNAYKFMIGTLFSVMAGSCLTSIINPRPVAFELSPRYGPVFLLGSLFMALGANAAVHNSRREFYFTAIGNGIQNGCSSLYSANLIRTTHLTGTTTDIGLFVGQFVRGNRTNDWKLYILSGLATAFWSGSLGGYAAARHWRQYSLIFNAAFFFIIGCTLIVYFVCIHGVSLCEAVFGLGKWGTRFEKIEVRNKAEKGKGGNDGFGGEGEDLLSEEELMELFDEIDAELDGRITQDRLMEALLSKSLEVKKKRRPLVEMVRALFEEVDQGDWTVTREDWRSLVRESSGVGNAGARARGSSSNNGHDDGEFKSSRRRSRRGSRLRRRRAGSGGPNDLREASIAQLERAGFRSVQQQQH